MKAGLRQTFSPDTNPKTSREHKNVYKFQNAHSHFIKYDSHPFSSTWLQNYVPTGNGRGTATQHVHGQIEDMNVGCLTMHVDKHSNIR